MLDIRNIDCMELMKQYEDKHFDIAIVDPPYGINIAEWDTITDRPKAEYWNELFRISKNQIVFGGNYFTDFLPITKSWMVWDKTIRGKSYLKNRSEFELIWTSIKTQPCIFNYTIDGNIEGWDGGRPDYNKSKAIHPTQKPIKVYEWVLTHLVEKGMKIIDTHLGSGSSAIACHNLGYDLTASEISAEYFERTMKRINNALAQQSLFH
jgi:site-specific DNA-methyltransferase (adenine-specific)